MNVSYKVTDDDGQYYGSFRKLKDAEEHAQEMVNEFEKDMFIEKITTELTGSFIPQ